MQHKVIQMQEEQEYLETSREELIANRAPQYGIPIWQTFPTSDKLGDDFIISASVYASEDEGTNPEDQIQPPNN